MKRAKKFHTLLNNFKNYTPKQQNLVKNYASDDLIKLIIEVCANINNGNLKINKSQNSKLSKYKRMMYEATGPHNTFGQRKAIVQEGGFLPILLKTVGSLVASHLLSKT